MTAFERLQVQLGTQPKVWLVAEMVREDLKSTERDDLVKKHGFAVYGYHE
jgi:GDPmannose 4,6-dehydratase